MMYREFRLLRLRAGCVCPPGTRQGLWAGSWYVEPNWPYWALQRGLLGAQTGLPRWGCGLRARTPASPGSSSTVHLVIAEHSSVLNYVKSLRTPHLATASKIPLTPKRLTSHPFSFFINVKQRLVDRTLKRETISLNAQRKKRLCEAMVFWANWARRRRKATGNILASKWVLRSAHIG